MPRLIWVFAGRTVTLLVLSCRGSIIQTTFLTPIPLPFTIATTWIIILILHIYNSLGLKKILNEVYCINRDNSTVESSDGRYEVKAVSVCCNHLQRVKSWSWSCLAGYLWTAGRARAPVPNPAGPRRWLVRCLMCNLPPPLAVNSLLWLKTIQLLIITSNSSKPGATQFSIGSFELVY